MYRSSNQLRFVHFADDTTVFASESDINNIHATVIRELVGVDNWLKTNKPSLNVRKTSYMIISTQKKRFIITIRYLIPMKVSTVKFTAVAHYENFAFNDHEHKDTTQISMSVGAIMRLQT